MNQSSFVFGLVTGLLAVVRSGQAFGSLCHATRRVAKNQCFSVARIPSRHATKLCNVQAATEHAVLPTLNKNNSAVARQVFPFLSRILVTPAKAHLIMKAIIKRADFLEIGALAAAGFLLPSLTRFLYETFSELFYSKLLVDRDYTTTKSFHITNHLRQGCFIGVFIFVFDCVTDVLTRLRVHDSWVESLSKAFATASLTIWSMFRVRTVKRFLVERIFKDSQTDRVVELYNNITDNVLYAVTIILILDLLQLNFKNVFRGILGFGGFGTIIFGLAGKDLAAKFLGGISLSMTEHFMPGDVVQFGDGTLGTVENMNLLFTTIRGFDETTVRISNADVENQRISNLTKTNNSQVKQKIRYKYASVDNIYDLTKAIKAEISQACPKLISDGSRPFRVHWTNYEKEYVEITVDSRFRIRPWTDEYFDNRQTVLEAILRASNKCNVEFLA